MACLRRSLQSEGLSDAVVAIIGKSWRFSQNQPTQCLASMGLLVCWKEHRSPFSPCPRHPRVPTQPVWVRQEVLHHQHYPISHFYRESSTHDLKPHGIPWLGMSMLSCPTLEGWRIMTSYFFSCCLTSWLCWWLWQVLTGAPIWQLWIWFTDLIKGTR